MAALARAPRRRGRSVAPGRAPCRGQQQRGRPPTEKPMRLLPLACLLLALSPTAHADIFNVTRTDDPLPDACAPGDCSLREAMEAADGNDPFAAADEIILPAGTHTLTRGPLDAIHQAL